MDLSGLGRDIWEQLFGGLRGLFQWFFDLVASLALPFLESLRESLVSAFPSAADIDFGALTPYLSAVNAWVPLDFAATLFILWVTMEGSVFSVRLLLRCIPTM